MGRLGELGTSPIPSSASNIGDQVWKWAQDSAGSPQPLLAWQSLPPCCPHTPCRKEPRGREGRRRREELRGADRGEKMDEINLRGGQGDSRCPGWAEWAEDTPWLHPCSRAQTRLWECAGWVLITTPQVPANNIQRRPQLHPCDYSGCEFPSTPTWPEWGEAETRPPCPFQGA